MNQHLGPAGTQFASGASGSVERPALHWKENTTVDHVGSAHRGLPAQLNWENAKITTGFSQRNNVNGKSTGDPSRDFVRQAPFEPSSLMELVDDTIFL